MTKATPPKEQVRLITFLAKGLKLVFAACALAPVLGAATASGQSLYWDPDPANLKNGAFTGGSGSWSSTAANWTNATDTPLGGAHVVWNDGNTAVFQTTGNISVPSNVSVDDSITVFGITISYNGVDIQPGAGSLTVAGTGAQISISTGKTATISAQISNSVSTDSLTTTGGGTLNLSNNNAQTYFGASADITGNTTLQAAGAFSLPTVNFTVDGLNGNGSTLALNGVSQSISSLADGTTGGGRVTNSNAAAPC